MRRGETRRVAQVVRAQELLESADAIVSDAKRRVLAASIARVVRLFTPEEHDAYGALRRWQRWPH